MLDERDSLIKKIKKENGTIYSLKIEDNKNFNLIILDFWNRPRLIMALNSYNKKKINGIKKSQDKTILPLNHNKKEIWYRTKTGWEKVI